jgi:hypothetical protein
VIGGLGLVALVIAALVLAALAVLVDRLNFPQRRFRPRSVPLVEGEEPRRDRTGAHIVGDSDTQL